MFGGCAKNAQADSEDFKDLQFSVVIKAPAINGATVSSNLALGPKPAGLVGFPKPQEAGNGKPLLENLTQKTAEMCPVGFCETNLTEQKKNKVKLKLKGLGGGTDGLKVGGEILEFVLCKITSARLLYA